MNRMPNRSPDQDKLATSLKAAATIVAVGVVVAFADARWHRAPEAVSAPRSDAQVTAPPTDYFPSGYRLDAGEPEELPPTF
jgi:hypothetical protein